MFWTDLYILNEKEGFKCQVISMGRRYYFKLIWGFKTRKNTNFIKKKTMETYNETTAKSILADLDNWSFVNDGIEKKFEFKNFSQALGFIVQVGLLAESKNHHPELFNVYNKVNIRLSTHDAKAVTDKDFDLAKAIEKLF